MMELQTLKQQLRSLLPRKEDDFFQRINEIGKKSPGQIVALLDSGLDDLMLRHLIDDLSLSRITHRKSYIERVVKYAQHPDPEVRYYVHESLATNGAEKYYSLIVNYLMNDNNVYSRGLATFFLLPHVDAHADEVLEIIIDVFKKGRKGTKYDAYQVLGWFRKRKPRHKRAKEKFAEFRTYLEQHGYEEDVKRVDETLRGPFIVLPLPPSSPEDLGG